MDSLVLESQRQVMKLMAPNIARTQVRIDVPHHLAMHAVMHRARELGYDMFLFFDIDAIPVSKYAVPTMIDYASQGYLVGNVQRSNHINNGQHVFVAPSCMAFTWDTYVAAGKPRFDETSRSDVAEEFTWALEERSGNIKFFMPIRYENRPPECESWALAEGMPHYGLDTTFGVDDEELTFHAFCMRAQGDRVQSFAKKCVQIYEDNVSPNVTKTPKTQIPE